MTPMIHKTTKHEQHWRNNPTQWFGEQIGNVCLTTHANHKDLLLPELILDKAFLTLTRNHSRAAQRRPIARACCTMLYCVMRSGTKLKAKTTGDAMFV